MDPQSADAVFQDFVAVVQALRTPGTGCPWDLEQDHRTLRPYLIEETYEVIDAIDHGDDRALQEELGDLLLQVVLHAQLAADRRAFTIAEVVQGIRDKMVRRHPHVFGDVRVSGSAEVLRNWEQIKAAEKSAGDSPVNPLGQVPQSLPALLRAQRLGRKAEKSGRGLEAKSDVLAEARQQLEAVEAELRTPSEAEERHERLKRGFGDLLFNLSQAARRLGLDAEESLRASNRRFVEQFHESDRGASNEAE